MDAIEELMDEHRVIEQVLLALEEAARREVPLDFYSRAIDFITNFADARHHAKEEDRLFPLLEARGIPAQGPTGVMREEHVIGRGHVQRMRGHLEDADWDGLRGESLAYAALLRDHIAKEDHVLYPMGRNVLTPMDMDTLRKGFDEVEEAAQGEPDYRAMAAALLKQARTGA